MLLIITNGLDGIIDEIIGRIDSEKVFRFNVDLWIQYTFEITPEGFWLSEPTGRVIDNNTIKSLYWRKPTFDDSLVVPAGGCIEAWQQSQISYFTKEIYNFCNRYGLVRLVEKGAEQRFGKFSQLQLAAKFFDVPRWRYVKSETSPTFSIPTITKPLVMDFVSDYKVMYTSIVESGSLDPKYPWLPKKQLKQITI